MSAAGKTIGQHNAAEVTIGAIVVALLVAFLAYNYARSGAGSLSGYEVRAQLAKVDGLGIGTDVRISGIKVGTISDMTLNPANYLVVVHMDIKKDVQIPVDSSLIVTSSGILGGQYVSITPGGDDKMLPPGGMIENAQGSVDLMGLVGRFMGGGSGTSQSAPAPKAPASLPAGP